MFASVAQMLHFVEHDNRAVLPENLGTPSSESIVYWLLPNRRSPSIVGRLRVVQEKTMGPTGERLSMEAKKGAG